MTTDHDLLKEIQGDIKAIRNRMDAECGDHETRIRGLETFQDRVLGVAIVLGGAAGITGSFLGAFAVKVLGW